MIDRRTLLAGLFTAPVALPAIAQALPVDPNPGPGKMLLGIDPGAPGGGTAVWMMRDPRGYLVTCYKSQGGTWDDAVYLSTDGLNQAKLLPGESLILRGDGVMEHLRR
ncbi:hypothetical protein HOU02_gp230 [Caulobacter phage CcrBL9]|uniref:Uncharacterized protein n=1 Tax=Caulobacter phage CcrBL9 TaxID=2283270 RepID=A0A385EEP2_9CAUD|nr:hypothetical protein HOU02_gp230 [Caulobacter phage CcrBL9]AXQ69495.1 hypothetical protein CcrBL9_gp471 [Caulobacter phage CcrBL9]